MTMSPRTQSFLDRRVGDRRVGDHPVAGPAIEGAFGAADGYGVRTAAINSLTTLTPVGKTQARWEALPAALKGLVKSQRLLEKMRAQIKASSAALHVPPVDPTDTRGAIVDAEIRSWFSALDVVKRQATAMTTTDPRVLRAIVDLPDVAGLSGPLASIVDQVRQRYAELIHPEEIKSIAEMEAVAAEMDAATQVAESEIRRLSGMHQRDFDLAMQSAEKQIDTPLLFKANRTGEIFRVWPEKRGTKEFQRVATPDEIRDGIDFDPAKHEPAVVQ